MLSRSAQQSRLLLGKVRDFMLRMPLKSVQRAQVFFDAWTSPTQRGGVFHQS
jgi:hypothetical protein